MRTSALTLIVVTLLTTPALALPGGNGPKPKLATLRVVNDSSLDVEVSLDGGFNFTPLEDGGGLADFLITATNKTEATIIARLIADPGISNSATAALQANKTTVATVSAASSSISIDVARPSNTARLVREAGVALASSSGLLLLLGLGCLLGRRPLRRQPLADRH